MSSRIDTDPEKLEQGLASLVLTIIEALNRRRVTSLEVLHARTGLPKSTLVRLDRKSVV